MPCQLPLLSAVFTGSRPDQSAISQRITHGVVRFPLFRVTLGVFPWVFVAVFLLPVVVILAVVFNLGSPVIHIVFLVALLALVDMPVSHPLMFVEVSEGFFNPALEADLTALHGAVRFRIAGRLERTGHLRPFRCIPDRFQGSLSQVQHQLAHPVQRPAPS